jgi:putative transposase
LFLRVLDSYRGNGYLLHEYVLMPEHFHILITPRASLEKAVQLVKGGFSFRANKEIGSTLEIWQTGFSDHRIRDVEDYRKHFEYIRRNPLGRRLAERAEDYAYCSNFPGSVKDEVPQWLKPLTCDSDNGTAKAAPLQGTTATSDQDIKAVIVQDSEIAPGQRFRYLGDHSRAEALRLQASRLKS